MIKGLNFRLLRNAELLQFMDYIIKAVERNNPTALKLDAKLLALKNVYTQLDALFKLPQDSLLTNDLQALDAKRDLAVRGISKLVDAYLNHFDPAYVDAAKLLERNLTMYGSQIYNMNYQAESTTLTNLIEDWTTQSSLADAVALLGLGDWKDDLNTNNSDFITRYSERNQEYSTESLDKIKAKRIEVYTAYYAVRDLITSYATIDSSVAGYQQLIREFNSYIDQYSTLLASRKGKKKQEE